MKDKTFEMEETFLSKYAFKSINTVGRLKKETPCPMRTEFQRDRDRIIHSKAFRRLKNKTQVFFSPEGDHYRTRLTHTLTVSQVARAIARALSLNEDLTEAIALGHDLGHTPFGHSGERILNALNPKGFRHNENSGRVVDLLESDGKGLNLTREVVDGIINHKLNSNPKTLEGKAVSLADRIAYINHDIDDAIDSGIITFNHLPKDLIEILGETSSQRINTMVQSIFIESDGKNKVEMQPEIALATNQLRDFLFENVYNADTFKKEEEKANRMISALYNYYKENLNLMPEFYVKLLNDYDKDTVLCDYISGMSDGFVVKKFTELFIPDKWKL
ncbi:MAG: deoxyguanosinetriphosphate triphosphohydrolase [Clostridia bacterium]|nr:deoxyguanosinetriphosphate triphosphohydrolase [Clostridia bacterium]